MRRDYGIDGTTLLNDQVTASEYYVRVGEKLYTGKGFAKRGPEDRPDNITGELLSLSRALHDLANQMKQDAWNRIRKADRGKPFRWTTEFISIMGEDYQVPVQVLRARELPPDPYDDEAAAEWYANPKHRSINGKTAVQRKGSGRMLPVPPVKKRRRWRTKTRR